MVIELGLLLMLKWTFYWSFFTENLELEIFVGEYEFMQLNM